MARFVDHQRAVELRKQGMSYSQIKKTLSVSKSTLSLWLKDYPLSRERIKELWNTEQRVEKYRETRRHKKELRLNQVYAEQKKLVFPLSPKELFIAGLFLYWGEGGKRTEAKVTLSNTDPALLRFFIKWAETSLKVPISKFKVYLQLYQDMNFEDEVEYWTQKLNIPKNQFGKPYIKKSSQYNINHKGAFGHGTCNVNIGDARLQEKVLMSIKTISDKYLGQ